MSNRAYRIIFILLSCCIVSVLLLQAYWIRSFYLREAAAFDRNVYAALEKLAVKMKERMQLQAMKMTYFIVDGDTIAKTPSRNNLRMESEHHVEVINKNSTRVSVKNTLHAGKDSAHHDVVIIEDNDTVVIGGNEQQVSLKLPGAKAKVKVYGKNGKIEKQIIKGGSDFPPSPDFKELVNKMIMEIKVMDSQAEDPDALKLLIQQTLANQGVFLPFEFSMQKLINKSKKVLTQSKHFSERQKSYRYDLSANNVISTDDYLFLQFPDREKFMMAGIKGSLLLSLFFSLIILSVFYCVMRLLLQQKKLSEIKNDFINNMTHELKTPIATISLAIDGMHHPAVKNDPEKFEEYIRILKEENHKLNNHVERVLQMALLEKGQLQLQKQQLNMVQIIQTAIDSHSLQIRQHQATVNFFCAEKEALFLGDELHLVNVFTNLLDNALKYSKAPCVIDIHLQRTRGDILIRFKDNGIGIAAEARDKVFEKFYRVQGGNLHDVKGFGLGLSYVRSVVEAHGGSIDLHSEKEKGSEFIITLNTHGT